MDPDSLATTTSNAPRKVRFAPKVPPRRDQKPVVAKVEKVEDGVDAAQAEELLRRFNESSVHLKPKVERKAGPAQVAFGYGGSSTSTRSYGAPKGVNRISYSDGGGAVHRMEKEYKEPWDYYTQYPVTLPLRRPYSGDPEPLDEEEFGEASESYDEGSTNTALELGLMDGNMEESMFFLQLPASMPMVQQSSNTERSEMENGSKPPKSGALSQKACRLDELPAGFMGKILVYRSGAVKLKLGDTLYDVSVGLDCLFAQDVVAVNAEEKHCCTLGELNKRVIITPDVDSILDAMSDL
ncbi:hypothetical protein ACH5RR_004003 [Cinchona calisaya]|uniref:DNA-directed RNA polymerase III subunit RPC4 n=1 Tax=Cinchona calisaya TaxID=153742 RepID=A0ABD3AX72_9GENT